MRIESLKPHQKRHRQRLFEDLPPALRSQAAQILKRLCARWEGRLPPWRYAILCGRAKDLVLHPRNSAWGRHMLAILGGRARQRQCRAQGIHPTRKATMVRLARQKVKKQNPPSAPLSSAMERPSSSTTPPWEDPVQIRLQREAEAAWVDDFLGSSRAVATAPLKRHQKHYRPGRFENLSYTCACEPRRTLRTGLPLSSCCALKLSLSVFPYRLNLMRLRE